MNDPSAEQRARPRPSPALLVGAVLLMLGAALLVAAATRSHGSTPTTLPSPASVSQPSTTTETLPAVAGPFAAGRTPLRGFGEIAVRVTEADGSMHAFCMLAAISAAQRAQGLMTVTDTTLGGYDGMAFVFPTDGDGGFWMRNTPMPLSLAYLDAAGRLVSKVDMAPCGDTPDCRLYRPTGPFRLALEVPRGRLARLGLDSTVTVEAGGECIPKA